MLFILIFSVHRVLYSMFKLSGLVNLKNLEILHVRILILKAWVLELEFQEPVFKKTDCPHIPIILIWREWMLDRSYLTTIYSVATNMGLSGKLISISFIHRNAILSHSMDSLIIPWVTSILFSTITVMMNISTSQDFI